MKTNRKKQNKTKPKRNKQSANLFNMHPECGLHSRLPEKITISQRGSAAIAENWHDVATLKTIYFQRNYS